jgi:hypothetical protein
MGEDAHNNVRRREEGGGEGKLESPNQFSWQ